MRITLLFTLLYGSMMSVPQKYLPMDPIEVNGMSVSWCYKQDRIHFKITSPAKGWVALGINSENQLAQTNLIMGAIEKNGITLMEDRYILRPGRHQAVEALGGTSQLEDIKIRQCPWGTSMRFSLPIDAKDAFHQDLCKGQKRYLLLVYALEDDFGHHSVMRTHIAVSL